MSTEQKMKIIAEVKKMIADNGVYAEQVYITIKGEIAIFVEGDWEYDHLFLDYLMAKNGYAKVSEEALPSEEDWYTATHYYN